MGRFPGEQMAFVPFGVASLLRSLYCSHCQRNQSQRYSHICHRVISFKAWDVHFRVFIDYTGDAPLLGPDKLRPNYQGTLERQSWKGPEARSPCPLCFGKGRAQRYRGSSEGIRARSWWA